MKLTDRELWLMRQAFNDGVCDENFDSWLSDGAADGITVADVLAKNAPTDESIAAAVAAERSRCISAVNDERVNNVSEEDVAYNLALDHACAAIESVEKQ